jgi:hypothetical protein
VFVWQYEHAEGHTPTAKNTSKEPIKMTKQEKIKSVEHMLEQVDKNLEILRDWMIGLSSVCDEVGDEYLEKVASLNFYIREAADLIK